MNRFLLFGFEGGSMATGHYHVATAAAAVKPIDSFRSAKNLNKRFCSRPTAKLSAKGLETT
jgi:hypothetical protein